MRINVAPTGSFLNQNCAATPSKSFFNTIDPKLPKSASTPLYLKLKKPNTAERIQMN
jgi:hypothetical protein